MSSIEELSLISTINYILSHPLNQDRKVKGFLRFAWWQVRSRVISDPYVHSFTEKSKILVKRGMTGATGNLYCGLHEFQDMSFLLHFLRKEDLFVDIGANVGSYTILAGAHVEANTISFEPVPATYQWLLDNVIINKMQSRVTTINAAVGANPGTVRFTSMLDTVNHVATMEEKSFIEVPIDSLGNFLEDQSPRLMKIDVEGFETEVIHGAEMILRNQELKAIIIELNGSGSRYGYDEGKIIEKLNEHGFIQVSYDPLRRRLYKDESHGQHNSIFVRDFEFIIDRLKSSPKFRILNKEL